jgi:hypothetical protein
VALKKSSIYKTLWPKKPQKKLNVLVAGKPLNLTSKTTDRYGSFLMRENDKIPPPAFDAPVLGAR